MSFVKAAFNKIIKLVPVSFVFKLSYMNRITLDLYNKQNKC